MSLLIVINIYIYITKLKLKFSFVVNATFFCKTKIGSCRRNITIDQLALKIVTNILDLSNSYATNNQQVRIKVTNTDKNFHRKFLKTKLPDFRKIQHRFDRFIDSSKMFPLRSLQSGLNVITDR